MMIMKLCKPVRDSLPEDSNGSHCIMRVTACKLSLWLRRGPPRAIVATMSSPALNITSAEFVKGIIGTDSILNDELPHVAFIGRSNVGKSSLINSLTRRKGLAQSSAMPGKTRQINFFRINDTLYFTDLPGYGFARIKEKGREKLRKLILWYFGSDEARPRAVVLIIDALVGVTAFDEEMITMLRAEHYHVILAANKCDRISRGKWEEVRKKTARALGVPNVILYSAKTGEGRDALLVAITEAIEAGKK